jgi:hypothetical protein
MSPGLRSRPFAILDFRVPDRGSRNPSPLGGWDRGWARGYWVVSSGNATDEMLVDYITNRTPPEPDDNFNVT